MQLFLSLVKQGPAGPFDERLIGIRPTLIIVMLQYHAGEIHGAEYIAKPARQRFPAFQLATECQHRDISRDCKRCAVPIDVLVITCQRTGNWHGAEPCMRQGQEK